jgi:hypothetical protein
LVGFGFNALMLVHETNQPPSYFNDSGDTSVITGKPTKKGKYTVRVTASKKQGKAVTDSVMTSKSVTVY